MPVADALRRAAILADLGRYDEARALLAQVLADEPDNEDGLALLGRVLTHEDRFQEAVDVTEDLLRVSPDSLKGLLTMALLLRTLGRSPEGVPFARRAVELYPDHAICLANLAETLNDITPGSAEALALAERAVAIDPDDASAHRLIGAIHLRLRRYAEAERWLLRALRIDPAFPQAVLQLGLARAGLGRFDESRDQVLAALRLRATPVAIDSMIEIIESWGIPGHFAEIYGVALAARGRPDLSCPGAAGDNPDLLAAQGRLARRMYTDDAGREAQRRAAELADGVLAADPGNQDARCVRSMELNAVGQYAKARPIAERLLAEGYPRANRVLVIAQMGAGALADALVIIRRQLADNPDSPETVWYLRVEAQCLRLLRRYDEALSCALRAAALSPSSPGVQRQLGLAARRAGDPAVAERALRAALADAPGDAVLTAELALLMAGADRWPEAEPLIAELPVDPPETEASLLAGVCLGLCGEALRCAAPVRKQIPLSNPDSAVLEEMAHWLGLVLRTAALAAGYHPLARAKALEILPRPVADLRAIKANTPPDSGFAQVVRELDAQLEQWKSCAEGLCMTVNDAVSRVRVLHDLGRYDDADPLLAQVLAEEPDNEDGLALLGGGLVARIRFQEAADVTDRLLRVNPDNLLGLLRMALMLVALKRPRAGAPFARRAVELHPDAPVCLVRLADCLNHVTHGSSEAQALAERAIAIDPDYAPAHMVLGKIHLDRQQYAEAERWTLQALRIEPTDSQAVLQLGMARAGLGRFDESRDEVLASLRLRATTHDIDHVINQIECRGIPGHFLEIYRMALGARGLPDLSRPGAAGDDPELLAAQGRLADRMYVWEAGPDGWRRAAELADAVLAADPHNQDARYVRSLELSRCDQSEQALRIAEQLMAEGYSQVSLALARAQIGVGDHAAALETAKRKLADDPDDLLYLRVESQCLRKLERYDEALQSALRAAQLSTSSRDVQLEVGLAAKAGGDLALAERSLRAAVATAADEAHPPAELALLLAETGRWPEAETIIAALPTDAADGRGALQALAGLIRLSSGRALPSLREIDGADAPDPRSLEESAHWLGLFTRLVSVAIGYHPGIASQYATNGTADRMAQILLLLRKVPAPPDSGFAQVVCDFDALLDNWRA